MHLASIKSRVLQFGSLRSLVLAVTVGCTLIVYQYAKHYEHERIASSFHELARFKAQRVFLRVDGYERTLTDVRGLFIADEMVTEVEFRKYLDGVDVTRRYPALTRIGYAPLVTDANRTFIEASFRSKGLEDYQAPATGAPYLPVLYGYPASGNALGMDLNTDPMRAEALDRARDNNQAQITRRIDLRFAGGQSGFLLYLPVYGGGLPPITVAQRQHALSGYLYAAFPIEDLISSTIGPDLDQLMSLALFDGDRIVPRDLVYESDPARRITSRKNRQIYGSTQHLQIAGRPWTFLFVAKPSFIAANQSQLPLTVLVAGLLSSALATWLASAVDKRWQAEKKIQHLAFYDDLTDLPNRAKLRKELVDAIDRGQKRGKPFAVLIFELLHFNEINYTLGHPIGDELLKQAAIRMVQLIGEYSVVARINDVQFGVLLPDASAHEAIHLAERLLKSLEEPLPAGSINYELGAHAGITLFSGPGDDPDLLIRQADIALNQARITGRDYAIYSAAQNPYNPQRLSLLGDFRKAVKEKQLQLYIQPKANLKTGAITSGEALVRWQHPAYGLLLPDQFVPLIEPTELIQLLTQSMLEAAIHQCYLWQQQHFFFPLAVNLSTRNLLDTDLPDIINGLMLTWGANANWVELEITESGIMLDPAVSLRVLNQFHTMGLKLYVDDFGTGYSSLSYLMELPIDTVKIDHSFTMNMVTDPVAAVIVKSTIDMAHDMGMKVVAEGAATKEIWDALKRLNCDEAQGYYICPPLPAKDFLAWLEHSSWSYSTLA